jgi:hypothetical protein
MIAHPRYLPASSIAAIAAAIASLSIASAPPVSSSRPAGRRAASPTALKSQLIVAALAGLAALAALSPARTGTGRRSLHSPARPASSRQPRACAPGQTGELHFDARDPPPGRRKKTPKLCSRGFERHPAQPLLPRRDFLLSVRAKVRTAQKFGYLFHHWSNWRGASKVDKEGP